MLIWNACDRRYVPGNNKPEPATSPAAPAMMMEPISRVPCIQMLKNEGQNTPCSIKKYWNAPTMMPLYSMINTVPREARTPRMAVRKATKRLLSAIPTVMPKGPDCLYTAIGSPFSMFFSVIST